jgi:hypothetical protein
MPFVLTADSKAEYMSLGTPSGGTAIIGYSVLVSGGISATSKLYSLTMTGLLHTGHSKTYQSSCSIRAQ